MKKKQSALGYGNINVIASGCASSIDYYLTFYREAPGKATTSTAVNSIHNTLNTTHPRTKFIWTNRIIKQHSYGKFNRNIINVIVHFNIFFNFILSLYHVVSHWLVCVIFQFVFFFYSLLFSFFLPSSWSFSSFFVLICKSFRKK